MKRDNHVSARAIRDLVITLAPLPAILSLLLLQRSMSTIISFCLQLLERWSLDLASWLCLTLQEKLASKWASAVLPPKALPFVCWKICLGLIASGWVPQFVIVPQIAQQMGHSASPGNKRMSELLSGKHAEM